jgi:hypothetical protein
MSKSRKTKARTDKFMRALAKRIRAITDPIERRRTAHNMAHKLHAEMPSFKAPKFLAMCGYSSITDGTSITVLDSSGASTLPISSPLPPPIPSTEEGGGRGDSGPPPPAEG